MVSVEACGDIVWYVSADYEQILHVVGCLFNEVCNLKNSTSGAGVHMGVAYSQINRGLMMMIIFLEIQFLLR